MATQDQHLPIEIAHFQQVAPYYLRGKRLCKRTVERLLQDGCLQLSTVFENAVAAVSGKRVTSGKGRDFCDGSDAKVVTVSRSGTQYRAPVCKVKHKTGGLLVQVYERIHNRFYYFRIPRRAYRHIKSYPGGFYIPFNQDGTPKLQNRCEVNWWRYEVSSFEAMATGSEGVKWLNK